MERNLGAKWNGKKGVLVQTLLDIGWLDFNGEYSLHGWAEHNEYAMHSVEREEKARKAARAKWSATSNAPSNAPSNAQGNAPSPSPSPSPKHKPLIDEQEPPQPSPLKESPFEELTKEQKDEMALFFTKVREKYRGSFNPQLWIQNNLHLNPKTHLHVLRRLAEEENIGTPTGYANRIAEIEDGNYNERESIKNHREIISSWSDCAKNWFKDGK